MLKKQIIKQLFYKLNVGRNKSLNNLLFLQLDIGETIHQVILSWNIVLHTLNVILHTLNVILHTLNVILHYLNVKLNCKNEFIK